MGPTPVVGPVFPPTSCTNSNHPSATTSTSALLCGGSSVVWQERRCGHPIAQSQNPAWSQHRSPTTATIPPRVFVPPSIIHGIGATLLGPGAVIIHEHTRVGTGFIYTVLVTAHCPALNTRNVIVRSVPSALASNVSGVARA